MATVPPGFWDAIVDSVHAKSNLDDVRRGYLDSMREAVTVDPGLFPTIPVAITRRVDVIINKPPEKSAAEINSDNEDWGQF